MAECTFYFHIYDSYHDSTILDFLFIILGTLFKVIVVSPLSQNILTVYTEHVTMTFASKKRRFDQTVSNVSA